MKPGARSNAEWLSALRSSGAEQADAISDLRAHVLRAALYSLRRSRGSLASLGSTEINQLAEDCAQEAVLAILGRLDEFRGESRFTTWAYSFAVNIALVAARRERWKRVPLDAILERPVPDEWTIGESRTAPDPQRIAMQKEMLAAIREAIDRGLTDRQRQALKAIVFEGVPLDELVRHWGSNRNAVYKLLHDARRKLKAHLADRGFGLQDVPDLFGDAR
ncbi:MAG TPA: sigma-70 family RNA polymerase sigma factor [Candidatus Tectomicrobia bacterium]|nr:sigma-70 family RNA polymerase sigma factor [Candidatus Tectomicrobia bacterium]